MMTRLVTDRLMMRRSQPSDFEAVQALVSDYDVVSMTATWPHPADPELTTSRCVPSDPKHGMVGSVFLSGKLIGAMGLAAKPDEAPQLGYMFSPSHWGQGYATEMARALIDHCWGRYDWSMIVADVFEDNPASVRVLEKLGFTETGQSIGDSVARGGSHPLRNFQLLRPQA